jgi:hypothetical protein
MNFISTFEELNKLYDTEPTKLTEKAVGISMPSKDRLNSKSVNTPDGRTIDSGSSKWVTYDPKTEDVIIGKDVVFKIEVFAAPIGSDQKYEDIPDKLYTDSDNINPDKKYGRYIYKGSYPDVIKKLTQIDKTHEIRDMDMYYFGGLGEGTVQCVAITENASTKKPTIVLNTVLDETLPFIQKCTKGPEGRLGHKVTYLGDASASKQAAVSESMDNESDDMLAVDDGPRQVICECDKCGALVIKDEADIVVDEETDLVNVEDECQFCEEAKGFKIIGVVAPYEAAEAEEPVEDELAEEDDIIEEDLADVARKVFDKPASTKTQQAWEDELNGEMGEISPKRRKHLERKFAQQRDWEARHTTEVTEDAKAGEAETAAGAASAGAAETHVAGREELPELPD